MEAENSKGALTHLVTTRKPQKLRPTVLVLVTDQRSCDRLILAGLPHYVVTGMPGGGSDLLPRLWTRFEYLTFYTVDAAGEAQQVTAVDRALA